MQFGEPASGSKSSGQTEPKRESLHRYRIKLRWGNFSALFSENLDSVKGRQERVMALGFYYGRIDGIEGPATRRCWKYMREQMEEAAGKTFSKNGFEDHLLQQLKTIIQKDDGSGDHEPDPEKDARVLFPGSFCFTRGDQLSFSPSGKLIAHRYEAEEQAWRSNLGLGRIPLLVKVIDRDTGQVAKNVRVCFEFVPPYDDVDDQLESLNTLSNVSESLAIPSSAPRAYVRSKLTQEPGVPLGYNAPTAVGGRKPADVFGQLIVARRVHGFPHVAAKAGPTNRFSAVVKTDEGGEAGIVLRPPRTAGDALRLRVYVHPDRDGACLEPDAEEEAKTGVLTVWRQLRLAQIIIKPQASAVAAASVQPPAPVGMTGGLGSILIPTLQAEYEKAFHHLVVDSLARNPKILTAAEYEEAIRKVRSTLRNPQRYDLETLIRADFNSPYMFWLADDTTYNTNRRSGTAMLNLNSSIVWRTHLPPIVDQLCDAFCKYFTDAAVPGLTILRNEVGDSYSYWGHPSRPANAPTYTTSGVATIMRGCFLWYPAAVYSSSMPYPLTVNAMHEMGHVLYLRHHITDQNTLLPDFPGNHDDQDWCLMGYLNLTTNDHCGKCLLKLRGWNEAKI